MSKVDKETVHKIASLSKLKFDDEEFERIANDLNRMLDFVEKLEELDTNGVEPLIYMTDEHNILRSDATNHRITHEEALKNAPEKDSDFIRVPKVLDKGN